MPACKMCRAAAASPANTNPQRQTLVRGGKFDGRIKQKQTKETKKPFISRSQRKPFAAVQCSVNTPGFIEQFFPLCFLRLLLFNSAPVSLEKPSRPPYSDAR